MSSPSLDNQQADIPIAITGVAEENISFNCSILLLLFIKLCGDGLKKMALRNLWNGALSRESAWLTTEAIHKSWLNPNTYCLALDSFPVA
jgi:hypothetical protein